MMATLGKQLIDFIDKHNLNEPFVNLGWSREAEDKINEFMDGKIGQKARRVICGQLLAAVATVEGLNDTAHHPDCMCHGCMAADPNKARTPKPRGINPDWYRINGKWYHCVTQNGKRYVDGKEQSDLEDAFECVPPGEPRPKAKMECARCGQVLDYRDGERHLGGGRVCRECDGDH